MGWVGGVLFFVPDRAGLPLTPPTFGRRGVGSDWEKRVSMCVTPFDDSAAVTVVEEMVFPLSLAAGSLVGGCLADGFSGTTSCSRPEVRP